MALPSIVRRASSTNRFLLVLLFVFCFVALCADPAFAQNRGAVAGQVTTPDGAPLPGVQVVDPALQRGTPTGPDGQYRIDQLPTRTHTLEYRFVGYQTVVREVSLAAGETAEVDVVLRSRVLETDGVTVTGTARARSTLRAPQDVDVMGPEHLQINRSAALGDLLRDNVDGVSSIKTGSQAGIPVLRGLSGTRVLLLKDGIGQQFYQYGVRHFPTTNASEAERIEVVRGASSILYGSDALGGAINVITKPAPTTDQGTLDVGGTASTQYYTNNNERAGSLDLHAHEHNHEHDHEAAFRRWSYRSDVPFTTLDDVRRGLSELPDAILRVKGFIATEATPERRVLLQMAGRRVAFTHHGAWPDRPHTALAILGLPDGPSDADVQSTFDARLSGAASFTQ